MTLKVKNGAVPRRDQCCGNCDAWIPNKAHNPAKGQPRHGSCHGGMPGVIQMPVQTINGAQLQTVGAWPPANSDCWCRGWEQIEDDDGRTKSADA